MWWLAIPILALALLFLGPLMRSGIYARGFRREHFVEILDGLSRVRDGAIDMEIRLPETAEGMAAADSPVIRTSVGMCILWSTHQEGETFVHHLSISGPGIAWAFRGTLFAFIFDRLGLPPEEATIQRSTGVDHVEVRVPSSAHSEIWSRPLAPVPDAGFREYLADIGKIRDAMSAAVTRTPRA